mmetsp:Transcript_11756/g.33491  ORF Transcript_11756/g.33491 Transcript_11756/m.33491 type:complete len:238 (-) Transcript_11756:603-1316(-)
MNLAQAGSGQRHIVKFTKGGIKLLPPPGHGGMDQIEGILPGLGRHPILQLGHGLDPLVGEQILAAGQDLAHLDVQRAEAEEAVGEQVARFGFEASRFALGPRGRSIVVIGAGAASVDCTIGPICTVHAIHLLLLCLLCILCLALPTRQHLQQLRHHEVRRNLRAQHHQGPSPCRRSVGIPSPFAGGIDRLPFAGDHGIYQRVQDVHDERCVDRGFDGQTGRGLDGGEKVGKCGLQIG